MRSILFTIILALSMAGTAYGDDDLKFKWLREIHYEQIRAHSEGLSAFKQDGLWGYLDTRGRVVIEPVYTECKDFKEGVAIVKKKNKWGIIDKKGNCPSGFIFDEISNFSEGMAYAISGEDKYYLKTNGSVQKLSKDYEYGSYSEGLAPIFWNKKEKWGFINKKGIIVIEPKYDKVSNFSNGVALVTKKGKELYITPKDSKKNIDVPEFQELNFVNGFAKVHSSKGISFIDKKLDPLPFTCKDATDFNEDGLAAIMGQDGTMQYIDFTGKRFLHIDYDRAGNFNQGLAWVCKGNKYGYIDMEGKLAIDTVFTSASDFRDSVAYVSSNGRFGCIKIRRGFDEDPVLAFNEVKIDDANQNGKVEAEEKFNIKLHISNPTNEDLDAIKLEFAGNRDVEKWFDFENQQMEIPGLKAGADTVISFSGNARLAILSDDIELKFRGLAENMYTPVEKDFTFETIGINACRPTISKYWVYKDNHTIIRPGDNVNVAITVKNDGKDLAKDVKVDLQWPEGALGRDQMVTIPFLKPGETKDIMTSFVVDNAKVDSLSKEEFTIVAKLSEYTQKHNDIKYLSYHTGQMNAEINLEGGAAPIFQTQYASNTLAQNESRLVYEDAKAHQTGIGSVEQDSELLNGITLTNQPDNNKYALVIGNEDYNSYKLGASYEVNVDHAVQDASVFAEYAKDYMGVPEENIILLRNATYAQMNFNLKKVMTMCQINKGQVELYIFYAGHGQHDVDSKETYLIPVDVSIAAPTSGIKLDDIYAGLSTCGAKRSMVFMDACYSGIGRGIVIKPKQAPVNGNVVVFTATSSSQRSMPYTEKKHGLFTYYLLKTIKEANGNINMIDLYENVKKEVVKNSIWINNSEQTPELINGEGIESGWKEWNIY